jgi:ERCC4 domain
MHLRVDVGFATEQRMFKELIPSLRADLSVECTRMPFPLSVLWYRIEPRDDLPTGSTQSSQASQMDDAEQGNEETALTCEDHLTLVRTGAQLIDMVEHNQLREFFLRVQHTHSSYRLNLLVQGLETALRQRRTRANRQHRQAVVGGENSGTRGNAHTHTDNRIANGSTVAEAATALRGVEALRNRVQRALVWLQVEVHCHVAHAPDHRETAAILRRYTDSLAAAPYRRNPRFANFCAKVSSRSGKTPEETWMLQLKDIPGALVWCE